MALCLTNSEVGESRAEGMVWLAETVQSGTLRIQQEEKAAYFLRADQDL